MGSGAVSKKVLPRVPLRHGEGGKDHLTSLEGLAALSLDALSSVAYGPEAIVLVLAAAGTAALRLTLPVTLTIAGLLAVLVVSYCQVIAVHPSGGGAYAVGKKDLGATVGLLAAASLVVDYVLTVAVSLAAGAASLASAFPSLGHHLLAICLAGLVLITAVNLWGIAESARVLMLPMVAFLAAIFGVIVVGLIRSHPAAVVGTAQPVRISEAIGVILILKAFSVGCSALTGIEAIANGVPAFRQPRAQRAQRTELMLGTMLIGLSVLIRREHVAPRGGVTLLAQLTAGSFGTSWAYYAASIAVTLVLALAANTSFGGLPVLMSLLSDDDRLPHLLGLRAERPVHRYGVITLAVLAGGLLIAVNAVTARLIPLYAIGVFIGFTISQTGMVRPALPALVAARRPQRHRRDPDRDRDRRLHRHQVHLRRLAGGADRAGPDAAVLPDPELLPGSRTRTRPGTAPAPPAAGPEPGDRARRQHQQAHRVRPERRAVPRRRGHRRQRPPRSRAERRLPRRLGPLEPRRAAGHARQPAPIAGAPGRGLRPAGTARRSAGRRPHPRDPAPPVALPDPAEPAGAAAGRRPARQHRRRHLHHPLPAHDTVIGLIAR
jgi:amino acid transporter